MKSINFKKRIFFVVMFLSFLVISNCSPENGSSSDSGIDNNSDINTSDDTVEYDSSIFCDRNGDGQVDDSDNDTIADCHEGEEQADADLDGIPNYLDDDSDGDGILDVQEAGDNSVYTVPKDTDVDQLPDFLDMDSDNDSITDKDETQIYGTNPYNEDTDGDGFIDVAEIITDHNPNDPDDVIPEGIFYVVLPYEGDEEVLSLKFNSVMHIADVFFLMDRTGSMDDETDQLEAGLRTIITDIKSEIDSLGVGVGHFEDFGKSCGQCGLAIVCYGEPSYGDVPFELIGEITDDEDSAQDAVNVLSTIDGGGCGWASSVESLYQIATGYGNEPYVTPHDCNHYPGEARYGYPCFREGAQPIIVVFTDADSRNGFDSCGDPSNYDFWNTNCDDVYYTGDFPDQIPATYQMMIDELNRIHARVIGVVSGETMGDPKEHFKQIALDTGTVTQDGYPMLFEINDDGTGLGDMVTEAIKQIAGQTPQDIDAIAEDLPDEDNDGSECDASRFVKSIVPNHADPETGYESKDNTTFYAVIPGTTVYFDVHFQNDFMPQTNTLQLYKAKISVLGNHVTKLDEHDVIIIIPVSSIPDVY